MNVPRLGLAVALSAVAFASLAQPYRCMSPSGPVYSDRPCSTATPPAAPTMGALRAPPEPPQRVSVPARSPDRQQDHVKYLSLACAEISEAIRTGPVRGVGHNVLRDLREEYRHKCAVDDQEARKRASLDERMRLSALQERQASSAALQQAKEARAARCLGMRDAIASRRSRASELKPQDLDALRSLQATYDQVCLAP